MAINPINHGDTEITEGNRITHEVIGAAIEVHRALGPGLLETAYEECLSLELTLRDVPFDRQLVLPVDYKGMRLDCAYRLDLFVAGLVVVEVKATSTINPLHEAQLITYMKLTRCRLGLLINFNVPVLKNAIRRRIL
ncbi:MAG TPA: GxxExxY protein [Thermoanaerobaculia bacterium]|nr:GxxExxY protein [Thermoanaerobaculia bacterium]